MRSRCKADVGETCPRRLSAVRTSRAEREADELRTAEPSCERGRGVGVRLAPAAPWERCPDPAAAGMTQMRPTVAAPVPGTRAGTQPPPPPSPPSARHARISLRKLAIAHKRTVACRVCAHCARGMRASVRAVADSRGHRTSGQVGRRSPNGLRWAVRRGLRHRARPPEVALCLRSLYAAGAVERRISSPRPELALIALRRGGSVRHGATRCQIEPATSLYRYSRRYSAAERYRRSATIQWRAPSLYSIHNSGEPIRKRQRRRLCVYVFTPAAIVSVSAVSWRPCQGPETAAAAGGRPLTMWRASEERADHLAAAVSRTGPRSPGG